jgi:hypothetical protein
VIVDLPAWIPEADRVLGDAARRARPLGALAPTNFSEEVCRLEAAWGRKEHAEPCFVYRDAPALDDVVAVMSKLADRVSGDGPLGATYAARALEVADEARIVCARGTKRVRDLAARRYAAPALVAACADALAQSWLAEPAHDGPPPLVRSDDASDPRSLVSRLSEEIGRLRLDVRVTVARSLAPLAAVGDRLVQVAADRHLSIEDVERTVLHELQGHVVPTSVARRATVGIFAIGSARGTEGQEGLALEYEARAGYLRGRRARELALRHIAATATHAGAAFAEVVGALRDAGAAVPLAVRVAARVQRGGGLGREAAYIPAFVGVRDALASDPALLAWLSAGRLSVEAARTLRALGVRSGYGA